MPQKPLPDHLLVEALELLHEHGTAARAAHFATHPDGRRGLSRAGFQARVNAAREARRIGQIEWAEPARETEPPPDYDRNKTDKPPAPQIVIRPTYRVAAMAADGRGKTRLIVIGDAHDSPSLPDKSRFRWMGRLVAERTVDAVLQIGDFASMDSLSRHDANDTLRGKLKPSFLEDIRSFKDALSAFDEGLNGYKVEKHCTLGNHEDRALSFENRTPEIAGLVESNAFTVLGDANWTFSPYGAWTFYGGVGATHSPLNIMGKAYSGLYSENQISRDSVHDVIFGHTHKRVERPYPKLNHQQLTVLNVGCSLPHGHVEPYAKHSLTGWTWGVYEVEIERGRIQKAHWIPMLELEERYG